MRYDRSGYCHCFEPGSYLGSGECNASKHSCHDRVLRQGRAVMDHSESNTCVGSSNKLSVQLSTKLPYGHAFMCFVSCYMSCFMLHVMFQVSEVPWSTVGVNTNIISASMIALMDGFEYALVEFGRSCSIDKGPDHVDH